MKDKLWKFTDDTGSFTSDNAHQINTLYFPLCNNAPIMSSASPDLHGDIKTDFNSFLLEPVSRFSLSNLKSSRNFWLYINPHKVWSATGVSKEPNRLKDKFNLEAGLLWQKISRENKKIGLKAEITSFIPVTDDPVELMLVEITNISTKPLKVISCAAIPIFGRSAHNLHDHRHVTSLLQRVKKEKYGVIVTPTLLFDESGHKKNLTSYFVLGIDEKQAPPQYIYPTQEEFTGESLNLEAPEAVFKNLLPAKDKNIQGKETMAGLRFKTCTLKPKHSASYIIAMGITTDKPRINAIWKKFNTPAKIREALQKNKSYWQRMSSSVQTKTNNPEFDNWFRWVNIQPVLRRIFGCSFLPDFDYGKGGKGWRDLWQDCLSLILNNPKEAMPLLINNFAGVRIDGSNATIIGKNPGEFIADRNNISRVWMDHGIWPLLTTHLYMHQAADLKIFLEETTYFRDHQLCRGKEIDKDWLADNGKTLKTKTKETYKGTILEHILIQNLVQFFNVGPHNHILLEDADWNDGLDMAPEYGESVAFSAMYAQNLGSLCEIIQRLDAQNLTLLKELTLLFDSITADKINYSDINAKRGILEKYFQSTKYAVCGEKVTIDKSKIIQDLKNKSDWMCAHIRDNEWLKEGFFNGYYNNDKQKVEGNINGLIRMTLTGQALPVMSGIADNKQIGIIFDNACKYLKDKKLGGFHLNTDFKDEQLSLGRAFSFIYGDKENGAFFNHMAIMFAYALYKRGFAKEGYEVINSIYEMSLDTQKSKIYPCLPEYFNADGRGMYSYLTGSASWFILTLLTQAFGIRGEYGNLKIEPKLTAQQFKDNDTLAIKTNFADKFIEVRFINRRRKDFGSYSINKVALNGKIIADNLKEPRILIPRNKFLALSNNNINTLEVILG
ncbi:MAG: cellobiose phosphorylase [Candidatus Omnitrophica bacterium]|nr:cellobiose phosphorylase [Candidatus Omnitrophota bacterium]MDD5593069.1 cellobiose phosphorylase [Candidatus Omnitrophota bacterium]